MKKFIALALVMVMALSLFAGCAKEETTTTIEDTGEVFEDGIFEDADGEGEPSLEDIN